MRTNYILYTLTSFDIHEIVKVEGKVIEFYEGVVYRENFTVNPLRKVFYKVFASNWNKKNEKNDVMQLLVKLLRNSLYGESIRKDIQESFACKSEAWMLFEYDERVE